MAPPQHCRPPPLDEPAAALEEEEEWQGGRRSRGKSASTHPAIKFPRKTPPTTAPPPPPSPAPHHRDKSQWESLRRISSSSAPKNQLMETLHLCRKTPPSKNPIWPPTSSSPPPPVIPAIGHLKPVCRAKYSKVVPKKLRC